MIQGTAITLYEKTAAGVNEIGEEIFTETPVTVENVLIGEPSAQERLDEVNLNGRMIEYVLGIPKGDTHEWENVTVEFFGHKFRTFGIPVMGIEANIPLAWHKKVKCERYE
jgi:hypothetical protein